MKHPIRGFLLAPLPAPLAYYLGILVWRAWGGSSPGWPQALRDLEMCVLFGLPLAYATLVAWGVPVYFILHRTGWLRAWTFLAAGAMGGVLLALWITHEQRGAFMPVLMPVPAGLALGVLAASTGWWAGQDHNTAEPGRSGR